jgi:coenzyme Q-binding protein COQ10
MKHIEQHRSRYAPQQLFDLVADVERYPEFLPWVIAARIIRRENRTIWTDLTMGTIFLRKRFTTVALLDRPNRIEVNSYDPIFECYDQIWTFEPAATGGTTLAHRVDLNLKSHILQALIGASFAQHAKAMMKAYMRQADRLYGKTQMSSSPNKQRSTLVERE